MDLLVDKAESPTFHVSLISIQPVRRVLINFDLIITILIYENQWPAFDSMSLFLLIFSNETNSSF